MTTDLPDESLLERLIQASRFGLDDLDENRSGYLSPRQKSQLTLLVFINFCAVCLCFGLAASAVGIYLKYPDRFPLVVCLIWSAGLSLLGMIWIKNALPILKDVREGRVLMVRGDIHRLYTIERHAGRVIGYLSYRIASLVFDIVWVSSQLLPEGRERKVYYTPLSKIVVGVEPA